MMRGYIRYVVAAVVLVIVCVGLLLATYSVHPGEAVLVLRGSDVVATYATPGLRWKIPLLETIVRLDARTRLAAGSVRPAGASTSGFAARYTAFWRIAKPVDFFHATAGDASTFVNHLQAAVKPVLAQAMTQRGARAFLSRPVGKLDSRIEAAAQPVAQKDGVVILALRLGSAALPTKLASGVADKMAAGTRREIAQTRAAGKAESKAIAARAAASRAGALSAAHRKAAKITGASEARVAAMYAPFAKKAPGFFDYFLALESEGAALKANTRVLVLSLDSPWFKTLKKSAAEPPHK